MFYLIPKYDTFIVYYDKKYIPENQLEVTIEVEELPTGEGILRRDANGNFYRESVEHEETPPEPTIEEQILTETKYQTVLLEMSTGF